MTMSPKTSGWIEARLSPQGRRRERDIRRPVDPPVAAVERAHGAVPDKEDAQLGVMKTEVP